MEYVSYLAKPFVTMPLLGEGLKALEVVGLDDLAFPLAIKVLESLMKEEMRGRQVSLDVPKTCR